MMNSLSCRVGIMLFYGTCETARKMRLSSRNTSVSHFPAWRTCLSPLTSLCLYVEKHSGLEATKKKPLPLSELILSSSCLVSVTRSCGQRSSAACGWVTKHQPPADSGLERAGACQKYKTDPWGFILTSKLWCRQALSSTLRIWGSSPSFQRARASLYRTEARVLLVSKCCGGKRLLVHCRPCALLFNNFYRPEFPSWRGWSYEGWREQESVRFQSPGMETTLCHLQLFLELLWSFFRLHILGSLKWLVSNLLKVYLQQYFQQ